MERLHISSSLRWVWFLLPVILIVTGCDSATPSQELPLADVFYNNLNANIIRICGVAISSTFEYEGVTYQYTLNCAYSYDPRRSQQVQIEPVGAPFKVDVPAPVVKPDPGEIMINGYLIWPEVENFLINNRLQKYDLLQLLGNPKTPVVFNQDKRRLEQYFENMGFYRHEDEKVGTLHLIPYGVMYCAEECTFSRSQVEDEDDLNGVPVNPKLTPFSGDMSNQGTEPDLFKGLEERYNYLGAPLGPVIKLEDGSYLKPYTNMWMCVYPSNLKRILPCPLAKWIDTPKTDPHPDTSQPQTVFWEVQPGLGYNIPEIVNSFVSINGTKAMSGDPRFEPKPLPEDNAWMCFENYCVVFNQVTMDPSTVSFYGLGKFYYKSYKDKNIQPDPTPESHEIVELNQPAEQPAEPVFGEPIRTEVWDRFPFLQPTQQQVIGIVLHRGEQPLVDVSLRLMVTLPGDIKQTWEMKPTDTNGRSIYAMPLIQAPNGSRITYEVCTYGLRPVDICDQDSFTVQYPP